MRQVDNGGATTVDAARFWAWIDADGQVRGRQPTVGGPVLHVREQASDGFFGVGAERLNDQTEVARSRAFLPRARKGGEAVIPEDGDGDGHTRERQRDRE